MLVLSAVVLLTAEENLGVTCLHSSFSETENAKAPIEEIKLCSFAAPVWLFSGWSLSATLQPLD